MDPRAHSLSANSGENIRRLRVERGLTQAEVAYAVGVTQGTLSNYELGKRPMLLATALELAAVLGVSLDTLIEGTARTPAAGTAPRQPEHDRVTPLRPRDANHPRPLAMSRR